MSVETWISYTKTFVSIQCVYRGVRFMVFNATFINISAISWRSVLLVEEAGLIGENTDLPQVTNKLYHIMLWCIYIIIYIYHGIVWFWVLIKGSKKLCSHFIHWPNNFFLCTLSACFAFGKLILDQLYYWWQKISTRAKKGIIIA